MAVTLDGRLGDCGGAKDSMDTDYLVVVKLDDTSNGELCYIAWHPELIGCMSDGVAPDEARANLAEAREMTLEHLREYNLPIPPPMGITNAHINVRDLWDYPQWS